MKAVSEVGKQDRDIERIFMVTDTGGENWGTQVWLELNCEIKINTQLPL